MKQLEMVAGRVGLMGLGGWGFGVRHRSRRRPVVPSMIHYHGLPITPATAAEVAIRAGHAFISFAHPNQLGLAVAACQSFGIDNGAFSAWRKGEAVKDWTLTGSGLSAMSEQPEQKDQDLARMDTKADAGR